MGVGHFLGLCRNSCKAVTGQAWNWIPSRPGSPKALSGFHDIREGVLRKRRSRIITSTP